MSSNYRRGDDTGRRPDRREREYERDYEEESFSRPRKEPVPLNEYFIEEDGIHRQVLQMEICKYLGADATSRPAEFNGMRGFKIRAVRPFTAEMIQDLKIASTQFTSENQRRRNNRHEEIDYSISKTRQMMDTRADASQDSYSSASSSRHPADSPYGAMDPGGYGGVVPSGYPSSYASSSGYPATSAFPQGGPPQPGYPPSMADRNPYGHGPESEYAAYPSNRTGVVSGGYAPPSSYATAGPGYAPPVPGPGYGDPRFAPPPGRGGPPLDDRYYDPMVAPPSAYGAGRAYEQPGQASRDSYRQGPPQYPEYRRR